MTKSLRIAIAGCTGRMGLTLIEAVLANPRTTLVAGSERPEFDEAAARAKLTALGAGNILLTSDPAKLAESADAIIDFTAPEATLAVAKAAAVHGKTLIIGTTGWNAGEQAQLEEYARHAVIVQSGNFSLGVNILEKLVEDAARLLDPSYDIEIAEMHHKHKKDAPSGTALMLGNAAARGRSVDLTSKKVASRNGITGERKQGDIGFAVLRGGDVVGIHHVLFAGPGEVIELKHQGFNRAIYANGALHAALWAKGQSPGVIYSMKDMLGL